MAYKIRPGITRITVCGQNILVAQRRLWAECQRVTPLPPLWGMCWAVMERDGNTDKDAVKTMCQLFHKTRAEVLERLDNCFEKLCQEGFLIEVPDEDDAHDED